MNGDVYVSRILDITPLRSLLAIAELGGFHRAAASLTLTQSAVSQHVRRLEAVVGRPLVERDGRRVRFTEAGETLLAHARQIVRVHDNALVALSAAPQSQLVIGSTEHAADEILPPILAVLGEAFPTVDIQFRFDRTRRLTEALDRGTMDIAVFVSEPDGGGGVPVGTVPLHWCASPSWSPPAQGERWPLVAIQAPCSIRSTALQILAEQGISAQVVGDAAYLAGVVNAARAGVGVALLAFTGAPPAGLVERPDLPPAPPLHLATRTRQGGDQEITDAVLQVLRVTLAQRDDSTGT